MSLSKNQTKLITGLRQKRHRQEYKLFIAEGIKVVNELITSNLEVNLLFATDKDALKVNTEINLISETELKKISTLKTPNKVLGVFKIPEEREIFEGGLVLALDDVNDPGNLGTIIRLCDWFGVKQLVCSKNTVDCYNQKVVQSTMGSIARVQINYVDLPDFLSNVKLPVFTADMYGTNIYKTNLPEEAVLIMGNESNGISSKINEMIKNKLMIPRFGNLQQTESLNVATATAILLSEFKR